MTGKEGEGQVSLGVRREYGSRHGLIEGPEMDDGSLFFP